MIVRCGCGKQYDSEAFARLPLLERYDFASKGSGTGLPDFEFRRCVCGKELGAQVQPFEQVGSGSDGA